ncbi:MAG: glycosyltransferase [bacterium]
MRLAVLSFHTCPLAALGGKETGGMNVYLREACSRLAHLGVQVDVFTRSQDPLVPRKVELAPGVNVHHVPAGPQTPCPKYRLVDYVEEFVKGIHELACEPYDLIYSHYWLSGMAGLSLRAHWGIPMVHMFHTMGWIKNMVARSRSEQEQEIRLFWEEEVARQADALVAPHPLERAQLVWHYKACPARIRVIPCGVDTSVFKPMNRWQSQRALGLDNRPWLIFVGRLDPIKGLDTLLKAMALLKEKKSSSKPLPSLMVVGGPPWENPLKPPREISEIYQEVRSLDIQDLVHLAGPQPQYRLPMYYNASTACVLPSRYESFGLAALEAMACGVPVVASRVGGLSYTVLDGRTGVLVPEGDPRILAHTIQELLESPMWRAHLGAEAARRARCFSWSMVVRELIAFFREVVQQAKGLPQVVGDSNTLSISPSSS